MTKIGTTSFPLYRVVGMRKEKKGKKGGTKNDRNWKRNTFPTADTDDINRLVFDTQSYERRGT